MSEPQSEKPANGDVSTRSAPDSWREQTADRAAPRRVVGLIPAPEHPEKVAAHLVEVLPDLLGSEVDDRIDWEIQVVCDPLVGGVEDPASILDETEKCRRQHDWHFAICITDLPIIRQGYVVAADAIVESGIGGISLPALGGTFMQRRATRAAVDVVKELASGGRENRPGQKAPGASECPAAGKPPVSEMQKSARWSVLAYLAPVRKIPPRTRVLASMRDSWRRPDGTLGCVCLPG